MSAAHGFPSPIFNMSACHFTTKLFFSFSLSLSLSLSLCLSLSLSFVFYFNSYSIIFLLGSFLCLFANIHDFFHTDSPLQRFPFKVHPCLSSIPFPPPFSHAFFFSDSFSYSSCFLTLQVLL